MLLDAFFAGRNFGLRPGERYLSPRPFFHVAGSTLSVLASLQHCACLISVKRFDAGQLLDLAERERCTLISGNDTIFLMLMNDPNLASRKLNLRGGWAAASPAVVARIVETLGMHEVSVAYGLSEASPNVAITGWWEPVEDRIAGKLRPLPGVEVQIRDEDRVVAPEQDGEIYVRGWNVMKGYFDKPAETAEVLSADGWLRTGDLGRMTADGRLTFVGRAKDITRVGGENVANLEIEDVLHSHPDIQQAQVVAIPDDRLVEVPAAFIIPVEGALIDAAALNDWLKPKLANFKLPRRFWFIQSFDEIGMTASSKIQKRHLGAYARQILEAEKGGGAS
jgi:fatty-acyl-CoA synthase